MSRNKLNTNLNDVLIIVPTFRAGNLVAGVVAELYEQGFNKILVVDDCCPDDSTSNIFAGHANVIRTPENLGVGGAFLFGFEKSKELYSGRINYIAKCDSDGQHSARDLVAMCVYIKSKDIDYLKGNRYLLGKIPANQPFIRKIGNIGLSFLNKLSTGYWSINDPVNGLFCFDYNFFNYLPKEEIKKRFLFESSLLNVSSKIGGLVRDFPVSITYGYENSSLSIKSELCRFAVYYTRNIIHRIVRDYFYPNFDIVSFGILGTFFLPLGIFYGTLTWIYDFLYDLPSDPGEVGISLLLILFGYVSLLSFIQRDQAKDNARLPIKDFIRNLKV